MLNDIIFSNIRFIQKAVDNTRSHAALKLAQGEISRDEFEEVNDYCDSMKGSISDVYDEYNQYN